MDATTLLRREHEHLRGLFRRLPRASGEARVESIREIAAELILHWQLEDEFFYPALGAAGDTEARQLALDARCEHGRLEGLIERLLARHPAEADDEAAVAELERRALDHVHDEETRIFPLAARVLGSPALDAIGRDLARRRARLDAA